MHAFQPIPDHGSQGCISEFFGTAVNSCGVTASHMIFNAEIDNAVGSKTLNVSQRFGANSATFSCRAESLAEGNETVAVGGMVSFSAGTAFADFSVNLFPGGSLRLHCFNVPANAGIHRLTWTP
jgi:hypothetical protein